MHVIDKNAKFIAWSSWFLTTVFFAYQFVLRVPLGLIIKDIMIKFSADAADYGVLSSMYYYGYAGMQIPLALFLDRYGPRIVVSLCALACALASILFIYSNSWIVVLICRFVIGAASAAGFLGAAKVISTLFSNKSYGKMVGITFSIGLIGAVYGGKPMGLLIDQFGWYKIMLWTGVVGAFLSLIIFTLVSKTHATEVEEERISHKLKLVIRNPRIIAMAIANLLMVGALEGFADVWGVPYFMEAFAYSKPEAASITSSIFIGMIFGGLILAYIADKYNIHYILTSICGFGITIIFFFVLFSPATLPIYALYTLMFLVGIFSCYQILVFTIGSMLVKQSLVSVTIAFLNCINMFGGAFFHTSIGSIMNYFWSGQSYGAVRIYGITSYKYSLMVIPLCAIIGGMIFGVLLYIHRKQNKLKSA